MGGVGDLTRTVANGVAGLVGGAVAAVIDGFWTIVHQAQAVLPGPLFPIVAGGAFLALVLWTFRK
jgi:hypothetical protein